MDWEIIEVIVTAFLISILVSVFMCTVMNWQFWENLRDSKWISEIKKMEEEIKKNKSMKESDDDTLG